MEIAIVNKTMELSQCRDSWTWDDTHRCWCLEDVCYTPRPKVPAFQRMSIYAPEAAMSAPGRLTQAARHCPVVFDNNAAGYMQMPHLWLDHPRCKGTQYLEAGFVYITCGCSGRESRDSQGRLVGKAPSTLVDLKTAIRFLRHNKESLPGNFDWLVSVGVSAGGAMSALLGVTGDNDVYLPYLEKNGAFLEESDRVYAAQIYCPIIDLEHGDLAYEWMFRADKTCEDSHAGPAQTMDAFQEALSQRLSEDYIDYFNGLGLCHPSTGEPLTLGADGRSGSGYAYLMGLLEASATKYLTLLEQGKLAETFSPEDYLRGNYVRMVPAPPKNRDGHHAGPGVALEEGKSLGEQMLRSARSHEPPQRRPELVPQPGKDKRQWLSWTEGKAAITNLDDYVRCHRRRMKPCTAFDTLPGTSGENQVFGTEQEDFLHFSQPVADAINALAHRFPEETARCSSYQRIAGDVSLAERVHLFNPMDFITAPGSAQAAHFRIRVGGQDADTATTVSMALALKLQNGGGRHVDYAIVWDQPHCDADYPGELCQWIRKICADA